MYPIFSPEKIRKQRGSRTRREIVEPVSDHLTQQDLFLYEQGKVKPSLDKLPFLLKGLGCSFNDIVDQIDVQAAA